MIYVSGIGVLVYNIMAIDMTIYLFDLYRLAF